MNVDGGIHTVHPTSGTGTTLLPTVIAVVIVLILIAALPTGLPG